MILEVNLDTSLVNCINYLTNFFPSLLFFNCVTSKCLGSIKLA